MVDHAGKRPVYIQQQEDGTKPDACGQDRRQLRPDPVKEVQVQLLIPVPAPRHGCEPHEDDQDPDEGGDARRHHPPDRGGVCLIHLILAVVDVLHRVIRIHAHGEHKVLSRRAELLCRMAPLVAARAAQAAYIVRKPGPHHGKGVRALQRRDTVFQPVIVPELLPVRVDAASRRVRVQVGEVRIALPPCIGGRLVILPFIRHHAEGRGDLAKGLVQTAIPVRIAVHDVKDGVRPVRRAALLQPPAVIVPDRAVDHLVLPVHHGPCAVPLVEVTVPQVRQDLLRGELCVRVCHEGQLPGFDPLPEIPVVIVVVAAVRFLADNDGIRRRPRPLIHHVVGDQLAALQLLSPVQQISHRVGEPGAVLPGDTPVRTDLFDINQFIFVQLPVRLQIVLVGDGPQDILGIPVHLLPEPLGPVIGSRLLPGDNVSRKSRIGGHPDEAHRHKDHQRVLHKEQDPLDGRCSVPFIHKSSLSKSSPPCSPRPRLPSGTWDPSG